MVVALAVLPTSKAALPVVDLGNIFQNTITAIESKVASFQAVQQTVAMAQQLAQLWAIYNNATKMYKSIGNAVDSVRKFGGKMGRALDSWNRPITWNNLGQTLGRWGIRPTNEGALGELNLTMESYNRDINRFNHDLNAAPRAMSRDRVMRNIVRGAKVNRTSDSTPEGYGELDITEVQRAEAMGAAADYQSAQLAKDLVDEAADRERAMRALESLEKDIADPDTDTTDLAMMQAQAMVESNRIMLKGQAQQAAIAQEQSVANAAIREQLEQLRRREMDQAQVREALKDAP